MATCLAETILETAAASGFRKLSERGKLNVMLQSIYQASGSSDDIDTLMEASRTVGFAKIDSTRYKACILLQLLVNIGGGTTAANQILAASALSQFMFLSEADKKAAYLQLMCDINDFDSDASAFLARAGISEASTEGQAVNTLVKDLKAASLWDAFEVIYPIVGGTQASHGPNLKGSTYDMEFNGNSDEGGASPWVTHSSNGMQGDNSTQSSGNNLLVGDSLDSDTITSAGAYGLCCYITVAQATTGTRGYFGSNADSGASIALGRNNGGNNDWFGDGTASFGGISVAASADKGCFIGIRESSGAGTSRSKFFKDGVQIGSENTANTVANTPTRAWYLLQNYNAQPTTDAFVGFIAIGTGLNSYSQAPTLNTIVTNFQTTLGRN